MSDYSAASISFFKKRAKALRKELGVRHCDALNIVAQDYGYVSWEDLLDEKKEEGKDE